MNQCQSYCRSIKRLYNNKSLTPAGYQQVEWLKSTGSQYINTGVIANVCSGFVIKIRSIASGNQTHYPLGAQVGNNRYYISRWTSYISFVLAKDPGSPYRYGSITNDTIAKLSAATINGDLTVSDADGIVYTGMYDTTQYQKVNIPIYLFRSNYQNTPDTGGEDYIYYCKIYTLVNGESVLIRDYCPCYRKSDNKPGMYDLVTRMFFTNVGTDDFIIASS